MLIISKYKDYYDYLSGVYGVDNKIVLDRRDFNKMDIPTNGVLQLHICGLVYHGIIAGDKSYWGEELLEFGTKKPRFAWRESDREKIKSTDWIYYKECWLSITPYKDDNNENKKLGCAIAYYNYWGWHKYPPLKDIGIAKFLPAKQIYLMLCEWLAPKDEKQDTMTDKEKIVSHGYDLKESFRG